MSIDKTTGEVIVRPLIRTQYNGILFPKRYEKPIGDSLTVPDQALSIKEILDRHARGLPISAPVKIPIYHGDDEFYPDPRLLDLAEREEMIELNRQTIEQIRAEIVNQNKKRWIQKKLELEDQGKPDNLAKSDSSKKTEEPES